MIVKELIDILKEEDENMEIRLVTQYDDLTGDKYHNEINDIYISVQDGEEDVVVLESNAM